MRSGAILAALGALVFASCGSSAKPVRRAACAPAGDIPLDAATVLPVPRRQGPRPLLILAHPAGQTGPVMARFLDVSRRADRAGFAVLYPSAARHHFWALNRSVKPDDLPRVRAGLAHAEQSTCIDAD